MLFFFFKILDFRIEDVGLCSFGAVWIGRYLLGTGLCRDLSDKKPELVVTSGEPLHPPPLPVLLLERIEVHTAHVGDSRAILVACLHTEGHGQNAGRYGTGIDLS